ncbi:MAG: helix-turn-helix domain-containing protein, partial [Anaerolineae bacterium]|nr:helix-turn-helix domain-containing protein [Anaerolineae bacterium]NIN98750.1 helix-turn-helix domain-containing protein [Anaerolineae bacterium]NIQ81630.1 helix-turn-helix domain-containing protein [Anaerolineae bacterium]
RRRLGITQSELAKASGYSRQAIYLIERGLRKPTEATARALTRAME